MWRTLFEKTTEQNAVEALSLPSKHRKVKKLQAGLPQDLEHCTLEMLCKHLPQIFDAKCVGGFCQP